MAETPPTCRVYSGNHLDVSSDCETDPQSASESNVQRFSIFAQTSIVMSSVQLQSSRYSGRLKQCYAYLQFRFQPGVGVA